MRRLSWLALLVGCYSPTVKDGQYLCPDQNCPAGQVCSLCGVCVNPHDAAKGGLACPGCAIGERAAGDLRLPNLAVCAAAWKVPGVSATAAASLDTPCGRQPGADGNSAVDHATACSVEDNCGTGWHVCADEQDVSARGLTPELCSSLDNQGGDFFATRKASGANTKDPTQAVCAATGTTNLIGCGALYSMRAPTACSILTRYLGEEPATTTRTAWDCATESGGAWLCDVHGNEALGVTKPLSSHGGVLCCRDGG